jgi:hypothetical protein
VHRLQRDGLQDQQIQRALHEIGGLAQWGRPLCLS